MQLRPLFCLVEVCLCLYEQDEVKKKKWRAKIPDKHRNPVKVFTDTFTFQRAFLQLPGGAQSKHWLTLYMQINRKLFLLFHIFSWSLHMCFFMEKIVQVWFFQVIYIYIYIWDLIKFWQLYLSHRYLANLLST